MCTHIIMASSAVILIFIFLAISYTVYWFFFKDKTPSPGGEGTYPTKLTWDFANGNMGETTYGDSLAWTIHNGSIESDSTGIKSTTYNTTLRLYNTDNKLSDVLINGQFLRDVKVSIKVEAPKPQESKSPFVFLFQGWDSLNSKAAFSKMQFYNTSTTIQMFREPEAVYPFILNYNTENHPQYRISDIDIGPEIWASNNKYSWSLQSEAEPDENDTDKWIFYLNDNPVAEGNTSTNYSLTSESGKFFPNHDQAYLEFTLGHENQRIEYISIEKV